MGSLAEIPHEAMMDTIRGVRFIKKPKSGWNECEDEPAPMSGRDWPASAHTPEIGTRGEGQKEAAPSPVVPARWSTSVLDLGRPGLRQRFPIPVTIEGHEAEYVAAWHEVEAWASGETEADALNELKDQILDLYDDLVNCADGELGKLPRRWKRALLAVIEQEPSR
jgi:hypothetical protein